MDCPSFHFSISIWVSIVGGPLVDRTTNRLGSIIFQVFIVSGQFLLCLGAQVRKYWLLIIARMLLGVGIGNLTIVKNSILNLFFHGKELSLATGVTMTVARAGSVISFFISPSICDKFGHLTVLYIGEAACLFSFGCAIVFFFLELYAEKRGMVITGQKNIRKIKIADIKTFPVCVLIDKVGYRGTLTGICCGLMHPIILMLVAGITYSLVCSSIWSTPAVLVESHTLGTSLSIMTCIEMFTVGVTNFFVGVTIKVGGYNVMLMMFCLISTFGVVLSLISKL
ncbi:MAG: putative atp-dependent rna helicase dhx33, partial [Streblomastix strix]